MQDCTDVGIRLFFTALLISLAASGCSSGQPLAQVEPALNLAMEAPALPIIKGSSEPVGSVVEGDAAFDSSLNAVIAGTDLELQSTSNTISWGMWRLNPGENELLSVEVLLSVPEADAAYVAVSDYGAGSWAFDGPLTEGKLFEVEDENCRSVEGNCYILVVTSGGDAATVNRLVVTDNRVGWQIVVVDDEGFSGEQSSLAVVDGHPAINYYDFSANQALKYIRATTSTGADAADWGAPVTIDTGWIASSSMAVVNGHPAVCYWHEGTLRYVRSTSMTGADEEDWDQIAVPDNDGNTGLYCSLAVVDGNPAISYLQAVAQDVSNLRYARAASADGDNSIDWTQVVTVDSGGDIGHYTSLAVVDGNPAISYYDSTDFDLKYARSTTSTGGEAEDWSQIVTIDSDGYVGTYTSLAVVDGNPAISYWDNTTDDLKYVRSLSSTGEQGADWPQPLVVDLGIMSLSYNSMTSLAVVNGVPAIAYPGSGSGTNLYLATASTNTGADSEDWGERQTVDDDQGVGTNCSLAVVNGHPAISYHDELNHTLKYAILFE